MINRKKPAQSSLERVNELELKLKELKETPNSFPLIKRKSS